jgi:hypothetical protein
VSVRECWGADAAFPKAVQWHVWYEHWSRQIGSLQPCERFLVDATMKMQQTYVKMARALRKDEIDVKTAMEVTEEAHAWYERNRPTNESIAGLDRRLLIMFQALDGAYSVAWRLAQELRQANDRGYLLLDTAAERRELAS